MEKILLVDDEEDIALLTKQKFRKQIATGVFELLFSHNGQDALELVQRDPHIAVVVLDLNMPGMDGFTLLDKLKEFNPAIKTIVVSAYSDGKTFRTAMNKGAFDFVTKPVDFNDLDDVIMRSLSLYRSISTPLYAYQRLLSQSFPDELGLLSYPQEKNLLWDGFLSNSTSVAVLGIGAASSSLSSDIVLGAVYGALKTILKESPDLSLNEIERKVDKIIPSLKPSVFIGEYNRETSQFSYQENGGFNLQHFHSGESTPLPLSQIVPLSLGDTITIDHPLSSSKLSFGVVVK